MSAFIARQPNGLLCRYSFFTDSITNYNMTEAEYIELCAEKARQEARDIIQNYLHNFSEVLENLETAENDDLEADKIIKEMTNPVKEVENHDSY